MKNILIFLSFLILVPGLILAQTVDFTNPDSTDGDRVAGGFYKGSSAYADSECVTQNALNATAFHSWSWDYTINPEAFHAPYAGTTIFIPTYEESNEQLHLDVAYRSEKWNSWRYWMAMTPYPQGSPAYEDPSIVVSNFPDSGWQVPGGLDYVLVDSGGYGGGHLSDPDLIFGQDGDTLWCFYRNSKASPNFAQIFNKWTANGTTWSDTFRVISEDGNQGLLSPFVMWDYNGNIRMYFRAMGGNDRLIYITANHPRGTWSDTTHVKMPSQYIDSLWHQNGDYWEGIYYILADMQNASDPFYLFYSTDGDSFNRCDSGYVYASGKTWDYLDIYRPAFRFMQRGNNMKMCTWYSGKQVTSNHWCSAYTEGWLYNAEILQEQKQVPDNSWDFSCNADPADSVTSWPITWSSVSPWVSKVENYSSQEDQYDTSMLSVMVSDGVVSDVFDSNYIPIDSISFPIKTSNADNTVSAVQFVIKKQQTQGGSLTTIFTGTNQASTSRKLYTVSGSSIEPVATGDLIWVYVIRRLDASEWAEIEKPKFKYKGLKED